MVNEISKTTWICPYCRDEYEDYDDAQECANSCVETEEPETETIERYECKYCETDYNTYRKALKCEEIHVEKLDKHYEAYEDKIIKERLMKAGNHPSQTKIILTR